MQPLRIVLEMHISWVRHATAHTSSNPPANTNCTFLPLEARLGTPAMILDVDDESVQGKGLMYVRYGMVRVRVK